MRLSKVLVASLWIAAGLAGCSGKPGGAGASGEPTVTVSRDLVPLTLSGSGYVTRQASFAASIATVDGGFAVRTAGVPLPSAPQFTTSSIERGANSLEFGAADVVSDGVGGVGVGRGSVLEQIQAVAQGLELSWTFPAAPDGSGDALVRVRVTGLEVVSGSAQSTVLRDTASGDQLRVGRALWVDAAGRSTAVTQSFADGVLTFRVPEALLLSSAYPAVLDPLVTPASVGNVAFAAGVAAGTINSLSVGVSGPGSVTSPDGGINCGTTGTTCTASYTNDSLVTLTPAATDAGGYFVGWSGLCMGTGSCTIAMSKVRFVYAYFEPGFWPVKVFKQGRGKGTVSWNGTTCPTTATTCTFQVPNLRPVRQTVSLSAVPDATSSFRGWSADCGTETCSLYVDRPKNAYVTFASNIVTVRVEVDEIGTVLGPNGFSCRPGVACSFSVPNAVPAGQVVLSTDPSATFYAWGGDCRGSATTCTLTLDDDKTVYASWRGPHNATLGAASPVTVFAAGNADHGGAPFTTSMACTSCHASNLLAVHNRQCALCHSQGGPAEQLVDTWNGTCSAGTCHGTIHTATGSDHFGVYWNSSSSCDLCHTQGGTFPGPANKCLSCHDATTIAAAVGDTTPPVTTSDAQPVYVGGGSIHLTATDVGSGVALTYYFHLTHGRWEVGTDAFIGVVPTSGPGIQYTLQFYSIDHAGNREAVKSVTYLVKPLADTTPPTTTSSFNPAPGALLAATPTVALTATDGGSGVSATYYRIDATSWLSGTSFAIPDGLHTFSYYSVDAASNTEATHTSSAFRVDTVKPVTTSTAVNGATYTGNQSFTLTATDVGGSGVASTSYKLDAGAFTPGTTIAVPAPVAGSASHTLSWFSTDLAGNVEVTKAATFTVAAVVVDTTPPTTTSSFNPAAGAVFKTSQSVTLTPTDNVGGSGVKATYYRIDSGAYVAGTSFTVTGDGLHTFSYYSVDNANNTEAAKTSSSFRIDTIAPVTTSSAVAGTTYTGAQTFTLSPTDVGGSGVASTSYRLDAGAFTPGTSVAVPAPASGSASHTISWYSTDLVGNVEATKSVSFTVAAAPPPPATITLQFRTTFSFSGKTGWDYVCWDAQDTAGNSFGSFCDDSTKASAKSFDIIVPGGATYIMYGYFGPAPDGPDLETATQTVTPDMVVNGSYTWWWN